MMQVTMGNTESAPSPPASSPYISSPESDRQPEKTTGYIATGFSAAGYTGTSFTATDDTAIGNTAAGYAGTGFAATDYTAAGYTAAGYTGTGFAATNYTAAGYTADSGIFTYTAADILGGPIALSPSSRAIELGGAASRRCYQTLELRLLILKLLDYPTLATMLRVEQNITASVAGILYETIHSSMMSKMSRVIVSKNPVLTVSRYTS
jgi:hypothetical protein